jgi:hypothetical protein
LKKAKGIRLRMLRGVPHQADMKKPLIFDMHFQKYRIFWHIVYQGLHFAFWGIGCLSKN